ncbi:hypothetical protein IW148_004154 [Coemansia sp. RSA 1199]|nr:hypothetical protein IW148_004154 [Coemansia sp. RSA 1199]
MAVSMPTHKRRHDGTMSSGPIPFEFPSWIISAVILGGWAALAHFTITQSETAFTKCVFWLLPQGVFWFGLKALCAIHCIEAAVVYLACRHVRRDKHAPLSWTTQMQYTASTLVFGIFAGTVLFRHLDRRGMT